MLQLSFEKQLHQSYSLHPPEYTEQTGWENMPNDTDMLSAFADLHLTRSKHLNYFNTHMYLFTVSETKCKPHWCWTAVRWMRYLQMETVCVCVCVCVCVRVFVTNQDIDLYNDTGITRWRWLFRTLTHVPTFQNAYKSYRVRFFWGKLKCTVSCEG